MFPSSAGSQISDGDDSETGHGSVVDEELRAIPESLASRTYPTLSDVGVAAGLSRWHRPE